MRTAASRSVLGSGVVLLAGCSLTGLFDEPPATDAAECRPGEVLLCTTACGTTGTWTCTPEGHLPPQSACIGPRETCNGIDDDCVDGPDDIFECPQSQREAPCTTTCGSTGTGTCSAFCLSAPPEGCTPPAEVCNGLDDDCDGGTDDGFECALGAPTPCTTTCGSLGSAPCTGDCRPAAPDGCAPPAEICNGADDDCDGDTDEELACVRGQTRACTTACGSGGSETCNDTCTGWSACTAAEICNACDDDGDGAADEDFDCVRGAGGSCLTVCDTVGSGTCTADCSPTPPDECVPPGETCNAGDDDCDGRTDEDFDCIASTTVACVTACGTAGTGTCGLDCRAPATATCTAAEACNGCDDDGDGDTDEDFGCIEGATVACTTACGSPGTGTCGGCAVPTGTACLGPEVCNGCDDDGDGADDEDFSCAAGFTLPCTVCGGAGTRVCSDACVWRPCSRPEACNACDDDADGTTDEDFDCNAGTHEACTTSCGSTGRRVCSSTCGWSACLAPGETCGNGVDDDCDGSADESPCCPTGTVLIPAGDFLMGSEPGEGNPDEHPEHRVTVSAFCMARNEVTNTEYQACLSAGSCTMPSGAFGPAGHPVTRVNWTQARSYCLWAGGALPTEAQWEKAARGACDLVGPATCGPEDTRTYPWGEAAVSCALANIAGCVGGSGGTQAVGSISAGDSPYGIHDMCANAWELVQDCYSYNYYETSPSVDPTGPPGPGCNRVGRGGGWASGASDPFWLRVTPRMTFLDTTESAYIGFRCAYAVR